MPEAQSLAASNKRVANILSKKGSTKSFPSPDESLMLEDAERALFFAMADIEMELTPLIVQGDYQKGLALLATLKPVIDVFFDGVLVMAEVESVRANRFALLAELQSLFLKFADISYLSNS